jgi:D-arabinan endo alpha-(1,5)-arabinofuranosidase
MGAAAYIGRVGGLAVCLGVGTAIATGHGVAFADDTPSDTSNSTNSNTSSGTGADTGTNSGTDSTGAESAKATTPGASTTQSTQSTEPAQTGQSGTASQTGTAQNTQTQTSTTTSTTVADGVVVSAQTNTGSSGSTAATPTQSAEPEEAELVEPEEVDPADETDETIKTVEPTRLEVTPALSAPPASSMVTSNSKGENSTVAPGPSATTTVNARTVASLNDPGTNIGATDNVAVFTDARVLAAAAPTNVSPMMAALAATPPPPAALPDQLTAIANVVSNVVDWVLNPFAGAVPSTPAQPPFIWGLLAFARREFDNFFNALTGRSAQNVSTLQTTSLPVDQLYLPFPGQVSPSTQFVSWVTGGYAYEDPTLANTLARYSIYGTDLGIMWDNGIPDDPATPDIDEHQVLIAVGDTFGGPNSADWRANTILRSSDTDLTNGITIPNGQWYTGNWFGGAPLGPDGFPTRARQVIFPSGLPAGVTLIPTAGVSVLTPGVGDFGVTQYMSFMSVTQWGAPGQWSTNYSALAYSIDNGENWTVAPQTVRYNQPWSGNQNFQQAAFVRPGDGYVYQYGTPNGRQGAAYLSRVTEKDILDLTKYEYFNAGSPGGWFGWGATPAGWYANNPAAATPVFGVDTGACGVANAGNQVSEMSVQYNKTLKKYVVLYGDQFNNIVMRTSDTPQGGWSGAKVLMGQQNGGIYAPMMHPWSPSTQGTGTDLYWNLSLWSSYNVMLMKTDLTKV